MDRTDSSSAMMLLQYGGDDSDEENLNEQDNASGPTGRKTPEERKRRNSSKGGEPLTPSRRISEESFGKQAAALISDEEGDHHPPPIPDRKREHGGDDEQEEAAVPAKISMMDVSKKMAPSVSPYEDNNSNSSLPDSQRSKSQKKSSKLPMRLVSYGGDDLEEDEDENESSEESQDEDSDRKDNNDTQENTDTSPGTRGLVGLDGNNIQLPPEPPGKCPKTVQDKISDLYVRMRQEGFDTNNEIQRLTSFRNPSIYEKLIQMYHIDEKGSNFPLDVYNPHMWGKESFYDELDKAQKKDMERREKERKTKIEFISGTKKSAQSSDSSGTTDEKKRKSKWDALPPGLPSQPQRGSGGTAPNLTTSATGTRATIISAVGTLTKKNTFNIINTTGPTK